MRKTIGLIGAALFFVAGLALGSGLGALYFSWKSISVESQAMTMAVADSAQRLTVLVNALDHEDSQKRIELFESGARSELNAAIVRMHATVTTLNGPQKRYVLDALRSISLKRKSLGLGQYDDPPKPHIEDILTQYSD